MKRFLFALLLVCFVGCEGIKIDLGETLIEPSAPIRPDVVYPDYEQERPTVNLEEILRQSNWIGSQNEGSCVFATMISAMRHQGRDDLADLIKENYENGSWPSDLAAKLDALDIRYAYTSHENDVAFLEWAIATRRGAGVTCQNGAHMVLLVHLSKDYAGVIDNNSPEEIKWIPREEFLNEWFNSESWAVTPVYTPPPPRPCK